MPDKTAGQSIDILCIWRVLYNGSLTKSGSLEDVNAMKKYPDPDPTTLDEYIAKTKSESKPTSISMRFDDLFDDRVNVKELKIDKRFDDLVKELKNTRPTWPS